MYHASTRHFRITLALSLSKLGRYPHRYVVARSVTEAQERADAQYGPGKVLRQVRPAPPIPHGQQLSSAVQDSVLVVIKLRARVCV